MPEMPRIERPLTPSAPSLPVPGASPSGATTDATGQSFLERLIAQAATSAGRAEDLETRFAAGEDVDIHEVTAAVEEASLSLELLLAIRNKVTEAVNEVLRTQA